MVKAVLREGTGLGRVVRRGQAERRVRVPRHRAAVRPLRALRRARTAPRAAAIVSSLFQVTVVALIFALVNGEQYSSYYIFYGTLFFAIAYVSTIRWATRRSPACCCGRPATAPGRAGGSGKHIEDVHHALVDEVHAPVDMIGFISLEPRPDNGLRSLGRIEDLPAVLDRHRVQEVIIADPDFPEERAWSSSTSATGAASPCGSHRRRWRSWCTGRSSCPAPRCRCSSCARRCSTASTTS